MVSAKGCKQYPGLDLQRRLAPRALYFSTSNGGLAVRMCEGETVSVRAPRFGSIIQQVVLRQQKGPGACAETPRSTLLLAASSNEACPVDNLQPDTRRLEQIRRKFAAR
jgi:hypothetical protein